MTFDAETWLKEVGDRRKADRVSRRDFKTGIAQRIRVEIERVGEDNEFIVEGLRRALQMVVGTRE